MRKIFSNRLIRCFFMLLLGLWLLTFLINPSNNRDWAPDQALLPYAEISGDIVTIRNIRNFSYTTPNEYTPDYYDKAFDMKKIKSVDYIVEPFSKWGGSAHTFLSFGFESEQGGSKDIDYVAISVEIRKEKGETFSAFKGLFKKYELMYVIADEKDVVKLRSNYRKDLVYIYPIKATEEKIAALFLDMIEKANHLKDKPEFYNSLINTCTTNIMEHVNKISPKKIPFSLKVLMPGYSDRLAYDLGLINTSLSFEETRATHLINEKAIKYADDREFSRKIRAKE